MRSEGTVVQNTQESGRKYWAIRSSIHSFTRTVHSFICTALLPLHCLLRCRAQLGSGAVRSFVRLLAHSLTSELVGK